MLHGAKLEIALKCLNSFSRPGCSCLRFVKWHKKCGKWTLSENMAVKECGLLEAWLPRPLNTFCAWQQKDSNSTFNKLENDTNNSLPHGKGRWAGGAANS